MNYQLNNNYLNKYYINFQNMEQLLSFNCETSGITVFFLFIFTYHIYRMISKLISMVNN